MTFIEFIKISTSILGITNKLGVSTRCFFHSDKHHTIGVSISSVDNKDMAH